MTKWKAGLIGLVLLPTLIFARGEGLISADQAIAIAQQQHRGTVISSELVRPPSGEPFYRIKMISDGKVEVVRVNATR